MISYIYGILKDIFKDKLSFCSQNFSQIVYSQAYVNTGFEQIYYNQEINFILVKIMVK